MHSSLGRERSSSPPLKKINIINNMWFSVTVLLLAASACLSDVSGSRVALHRRKRMTGGTLAPYVPWHGVVYLNESLLDGGYAGGALISDRWILTAGTNLFVRKRKLDTQGTAPLIPKVYLGIVGLPQANASTEVAVEKVVLHPHFQNHSDWDNNLALIQLKEPVVMSDKVTPIPLPERCQDLADAVGGSGVITGWDWGATLTQATSLKHLVLPLTNNTYCRAQYEDTSPLLKPIVDDNMFCTGQSMSQENVCHGDAGGALAVTDAETGDVYAAGILSFDKCCTNHKPAVYMKISSYLPWIHSVLRGDTERSSDLRAEVMSKMRSLQP